MRTPRVERGVVQLHKERRVIRMRSSYWVLVHGTYQVIRSGRAAAHPPIPAIIHSVSELPGNSVT